MAEPNTCVMCGGKRAGDHGFGSSCYRRLDDPATIQQMVLGFRVKNRQCSTGLLSALTRSERAKVFCWLFADGPSPDWLDVIMEGEDCDSEVAAELAALLAHCRHVTIPFVGGAAILPHLKAKAIVANDKHDAAITFYRVLSGRHGQPAKSELLQQCKATLSHPDEMEAAKAFVETDEPVAVAWAFWALCWIGRKGKGGTKHLGGSPSVRRTANGGNNATRLKAAANDLEEWATHFERCEWESNCFRDVLPKVADDPTCGVYCDAPWIGAGRNYLHNFTADDHADLAKALSRFEQTTIVIRYGDHEDIRALYDGWQIIEASSRTQANSKTGEIWIVKNAKQNR